MKLAYVIPYVADVPATLAFYKAAFGLETKFLHESGDFGELKTGGTTLAFSSRQLMVSLGKDPQAPDPARPSFEIALTTDDVPGALKQALVAGARLIAEPKEMPWGQTIAYVSDPDGFVVELCTPMG